MPNLPLTKEDINCFFEEGELAVNATHNDLPILVIFRENYVNLDAGNVGIGNTSPMAMAKAPDVEGIQKGDILEIEEAFFLVSNVQKNSEYYVKIFLEAA